MKKILLVGSLIWATGAFSQVLTENFEGLSGGALPAGWVSSSTTPVTGDWKTGTSATANAGGFWPVPAHTSFALVNDDVCNCPLSAAYLTTPSMNFTGLSGVVLKYKFVDDLLYGGNPHKVEVSIDNGATWTAVYTMLAGDASINWQDNFVALGAATNNAANVKIRFKYDDNGSWATGLAIDDVVVEVPPANNAKLTSLALDRFALINANSVLKVKVKNVGSNAITSLTIDWNDGASHSQVVTASIAVGASLTINHPTNVTYATAVEKNINVTITNVNSTTDGDPSDNTGAIKHNTLSQATTKAVVVEEGTGTWCGWCPRGAVAMDYMETTYSNFIGIAVHNGDPMTVVDYDNGANISGFPGCNVDRKLLDASVSQTAFETYYNDRVTLGVPANLSVTASGTNPNITLNVTANFYTPMTGADYRLAVVMTEDGVKGTGSAWNQANFYSGGANGAMGGYETKPNPVPAANMIYDHVGRALLGNYGGQAGSVPATITDGTTATYAFPYTIPATSTRDNMHAVALLIDNATGEIINGKSISIADGSSASLEENQIANFTIFPNPATDLIQIKFEAKGGDYLIKATNLSGVEVASTRVENANGGQWVSLPVSELASGVYLVTVSSNGISSTQRVVVR